MTNNNKNNIPIYEEQQFISEEQKIEQVEEILNKFKQSIPSNFIKLELEEGNYCGSTNLKWNNKSLSERYFFTYKGKEYQIDIPHTLMEKLELEKGEDITQPIYLDPKVLSRKETYRGISIKEGEIFLQKPFTINNLEQNLTKLFEKIKESEEKEKSNQKTITNLKKELSEKEKERSDWKNEWLTEWRKKNNLEREIQPLLQELTGEKQMGQSQKNIYQQKIQGIQRSLDNLQNQLNQVQDDKDDYQNKWHNSLEDLEQKKEIIRSYLQQLNLKDARINDLKREKEDLEKDKEKTENELKKELSWWDKWINDEKILCPENPATKEIMKYAPENLKKFSPSAPPPGGSSTWWHKDELRGFFLYKNFKEVQEEGYTNVCESDYDYPINSRNWDFFIKNRKKLFHVIKALKQYYRDK